MNTIRSNSQSKTNKNADTLADQLWLTPDDLVADIEHVIAKSVKPYVDPGNPFLHFDELQAECRAKLARILHDGCLVKCKTRAKAFAFIKTSFNNHVRSLVQRHAFTEKRTGVKPPPRQQQAPETWNGLGEGRSVNVSLDDEEEPVQVGANDPSFSRIEFLEELFEHLTEEERNVFAHVIHNEWNGRNDGPLPLPKNKFKLALASIRLKGRAVRDAIR